MIANSEAELLPPDTVVEEVGTGGRDAALVTTGYFNRLLHTCSLLLVLDFMYYILWVWLRQRQGLCA